MELTKKSLALLFLFIIPLIAGQEFNHVISNSEDWKDVYSVIHYANLNKAGSDFLVSTRHGPVLLNDIKLSQKIRVITSKDMPYVFNYPQMIKDRGFLQVSEKVVDSANLELIKDLPNIKSFIVVSDSYGYNAIAVNPYALLTNSWVFLADELNIGEIESILNSREVDKVLIYGYVNRDIRASLAKYNPEIIDTGDRFKDNIEIVKKYLEIKSAKQAVLTNGEFIEKELMAGVEPVLFTGKENVPDPIKEYLKNSEIDIGVLIGNELVGAATNIKKSTGISVMVKFARGARTQNAGIAAVEGLDLFPIPAPSMKVLLHSIKYNRATKQLEVTYKSESNVPVYIKGTITIINNDGQTRLGDLDPIFIAPGDFKTVIYSMDLTSLENLRAEIYTLFGEIPTSLDRVLEAAMDVEVVEVIDSCRIEISDKENIKYNKQKKYFVIKVKNTGDIDCWVDLELKDVIIDGVKRTIGTEGSIKINAGKSKEIKIKEDLADEDIEENPFIELIAYFGEKEDSLVNIFKGRFELRIEALTTLTYLIIGLFGVIVLLIIIIIILKRREEEED